MKLHPPMLATLLLELSSAHASAQSCTLHGNLINGNVCQLGLSAQANDQDWFSVTVPPETLATP